ncbi:AIR synthase related protein [[Leptolyngbya] sp. PCC 7376]|uniref:sll0787 family AIR synthase-like protein n=1 Tax=[Leptolyngbya] sp. PCC 7376 TaxID=111781 RepID=UPI00029EDB4E|nr:sll0787 family AIR synthase-like protein [[Leptolyngbya] sp. PCC 7376]AFY37866.1 AIR synthase related protein [[Leptolyngbya] sp. PCC 7376]
MDLGELVAELRQTLGILHKRDIQVASRQFQTRFTADKQAIRLGDDSAAIPDGDGYLLLAAEGMSSDLIAMDPWFAGWCSVLVNVSDIYAMGGRPIAVVDALWSQSSDQAQQIWQGMQTASERFNVPIVGGHTNTHSQYDALGVAILGRAKSLITSFDAQVGDRLLLVTNFQGKPRPNLPYCWDAAIMTDSATLQKHWDLLPKLAEAGLCRAGKDVSMGGIIGTTLMLLETSNVGATLDLDAIPCPEGLDFLQWLLSFPSYGFLLSVHPDNLEAVRVEFHNAGLVAEAIATIHPGNSLALKLGTDSQEFWNLNQNPLTGFTGEI